WSSANRWKAGACPCAWCCASRAGGRGEAAPAGGRLAPAPPTDIRLLLRRGLQCGLAQVRAGDRAIEQEHAHAVRGHLHLQLAADLECLAAEAVAPASRLQQAPDRGGACAVALVEQD